MTEFFKMQYQQFQQAEMYTATWDMKLIISSMCWVAQSVQQLATDWMVQGSNPGGDEIFRTFPDQPWGPPSLLYNGYWIFPRGKERSQGVTLNPHPLLVPWSRKSRAIPLLSLWTVQPVQSLSACTRVHFTLFYLPCAGLRCDKLQVLCVLFSRVFCVKGLCLLYFHHAKEVFKSS